MTIRTRLALLFTLAALLIVGGAALLFSNRLSKGLDAGLDSRLQARVASLMPQLSSHEPDALSGLRLTPGDGFLVQVIDPNGTVLKQSRGLTGSLLSPAEVAAAHHETISANTTAHIDSASEPGGVAVRLNAAAVKHRPEILVVAIDRELTDSAVSRATHELVMWCLGLMLLAGPAAWVLTRAALRPVERLRRQFAALDPAAAEPPIRVTNRRDEIGRLAITFNESYLKLRASVERERAFVERERTFVVDAGHELRTPLAILKGELELGQRPGRTLDQVRQTMTVASEETDRLIKLSEDLLFLARDEESPGLRVSRCDVVELARDAASVATQVGGSARVTFDGVESLIVEADPDRIYRALLNLITNAVRSAGEAGTVTVVTEASEGDAIITVNDDGPGFPPDLLPVAFERFTRSVHDGPLATDTGAGGNGLGLAIVKSAMTTHGGSVTAANRREGGASLVLRWPLRARQPVVRQASPR